MPAEARLGGQVLKSCCQIGLKGEEPDAIRVFCSIFAWRLQKRAAAMSWLTQQGCAVARSGRAIISSKSIP